jgi:hypothetical protein
LLFFFSESIEQTKRKWRSNYRRKVGTRRLEVQLFTWKKRSAVPNLYEEEFHSVSAELQLHRQVLTSLGVITAVSTLILKGVTINSTRNQLMIEGSDNSSLVLHNTIIAGTAVTSKRWSAV